MRNDKFQLVIIIKREKYEVKLKIQEGNQNSHIESNLVKCFIIGVRFFDQRNTKLHVLVVVGRANCVV